MELSHIDKSAIINPVINELGVIPPETKERIVIQLSAQIDRIILEGYGKFTTDALKTLSSLRGEIKEMRASHSTVISYVKDIKADFDNKLTKIVQSFRALEGIIVQKDHPVYEAVKEIQSSQKELNQLFNSLDKTIVNVKEIKDEVIKPVFTKEILNEKSFSELIMIAKEKKIKIEPRTKKDALIQQILDIEKGDI